MAEQKYRVVLAGRLDESADAAAATAVLSEVLGLPSERVGRLLTGKRIPLHQELRQSEAEALQKRLEAAGVPASIEPLAELALEAEPASAAEPAPAQPAKPAAGIEIIEIEATPAIGLAQSGISVHSTSRASPPRTPTPPPAPATEAPEEDASSEGADIGHEQFFDTRARPAWADLAPEGTPGRRRRRRAVALGAIGAIVLAVLGGGAYLWLGGEQSPPATGPGAEQPSAPEAEGAPPSEAERRLAGLTQSVKVWMIQFGFGYDPTQVTIERLRKDLGIGDEDLQDPWGTPMQYEPSEDGFRVRSAGPDRRFDTADDLQDAGRL